MYNFNQSPFISSLFSTTVIYQWKKQIQWEQLAGKRIPEFWLWYAIMIKYKKKDWKHRSKILKANGKISGKYFHTIFDETKQKASWWICIFFTLITSPFWYLSFLIRLHSFTIITQNTFGKHFRLYISKHSKQKEQNNSPPSENGKNDGLKLISKIAARGKSFSTKRNRKIGGFVILSTKSFFSLFYCFSI